MMYARILMAYTEFIEETDCRSTRGWENFADLLMKLQNVDLAGVLPCFLVLNGVEGHLLL